MSLACCWSSEGPWFCLCCSPIYPQNKAGLTEGPGHFLAVKFSTAYSLQWEACIFLCLAKLSVRYKAPLILTLPRHVCLLGQRLALHRCAGFPAAAASGEGFSSRVAGSLLRRLLLWSAGSRCGPSVLAALWLGPCGALGRKAPVTRGIFLDHVDGTPVPCMGRRILNHLNTRENPPQAFIATWFLMVCLTFTASSFRSVWGMRMSSGLVRVL